MALALQILMFVASCYFDLSATFVPRWGAVAIEKELAGRFVGGQDAAGERGGQINSTRFLDVPMFRIAQDVPL